MRNIYFDNSATTKTSNAAVSAALNVLETTWGNPSSVHGLGLDAERMVSSARNEVIKGLGVKDIRSGRLIFTASGTEADNMAVSGTVFCKSYRFKPRIITTDSEHPALENTVFEAEQKGFDVVRLKTVGGVIDMDELYKALTPETVLISVMRVNNETGAVYNVGEIFSLAKERVPEIITHTDAVQGYLKISCAPKKLNADLVSLSGHKIGAPKGIGALWCDNELIVHKRIKPIIFGGGQEGNYRSGTENTCGIAAMGAAVSERYPLMSADRERVISVRERLISCLPEEVQINLPKGEYLPNIISLHISGIKSEVLVRHMSSEGIYISAGSACSSRKLKTSGVLTAFGLSPDRADSTVRVSLSHENTEEEAEEFCRVLKDALGKLQAKRR